MFDSLFYRFKATIICGLIGLLFSPIGCIIGLAIGFAIDRGRPMAGGPKANQAFLEATFLLMGYVAKADGQISQKEIDFASQIMKRWHLSPKKAEEAKKLFYRGKNHDFDRLQVLKRLRHFYGQRKRMLAQYINVLVRLAYINGQIEPSLKPLLQDISITIGLGQLNFSYYDLMFGWQTHFDNARRGYYQQGPGGGAHQFQQRYTAPLSEAYTTLGVTKDADKAEVKKAYRKMMSQYHPDKLMSKGLSDAEMQKATEKAQKIKAAYEQICEKNGW